MQEKAPRVTLTRISVGGRTTRDGCRIVCSDSVAEARSLSWILATPFREGSVRSPDHGHNSRTCRSSKRAPAHAPENGTRPRWRAPACIGSHRCTSTTGVSALACLNPLTQDLQFGGIKARGRRIRHPFHDYLIIRARRLPGPMGSELTAAMAEARRPVRMAVLSGFDINAANSMG